ncbi:transmembrane protein 180 isoform X2 [Lingula anatina]|nr:transmembrane protein 180 isoform X2 [Lingula anatina]|eukprot:XP_013379044.1 transmembrane protein 180 isoform X2 [Lingula anatina]
MVWNAINDPLFGYIQDRAEWLRKRRYAVLFGGPFYCLAFLVPWFPWGNYESGSWLCGAHLLFSLCLFDTLFTFVLLAQCAIFTEMSGRHDDRLRLVRYAKIASVLNSGTLFATNMISDNLNDIPSFQKFAVVLACLAMVCFYITGTYAHTEYELRQVVAGKPEKSRPVSQYSFMRQAWQLLTQKNFLCFVAMNFCQEFHRAFMNGFTAIITDTLFSPEVLPTFHKSVFYSMRNVLTPLLVVSGTFLVSKYGAFAMIRSNFIIKIFSSVIMLLIGRNQPLLLILFMTVDFCATNAAFALSNIPLSDIADADKKLYSRPHPISTSVYGTNALVVKPAISVSPMIVVTILNRYGYEQYKLGQLTDGLLLDSLQGTMFYLLCFIPLVVGTIQLAIWSQFTLRSSHKVSHEDTDTERVMYS